MKQADIFLNGCYPESELEFYRDIITAGKGRHLQIAADGALHLFHYLGLRPDVAIGDFDSVSRDILSAFSDLPQVRHPREKDATDGELAVDYALEQGCRQLDVYGAIDTKFETDQMLANIFLLARASTYGKKHTSPVTARLTDHRQQVYFIEDMIKQFAGVEGDLFSIIPISSTIVLTVHGARWELDKAKITRGSSRTLRNAFVADTVTLEISGAAVVVHRYR